jgi:hypothetical protein
MPSSHKVTLRPASGTEFHEVEFTFGCSFPRPRERMIKEGFGFEIELPAVFDLLTAIDDGDPVPWTLRPGKAAPLRSCAPALSSGAR